MKDDYLWDGSGEPDPDVEQLKKRRGQYRYQARPLDELFEQPLGARRSFFWVKYAAAAALIVMALAGAWLLRSNHLQDGQWQAVARVPDWLPAPGDGLVDSPKETAPTPPSVTAPATTSTTGAVSTHERKRGPRPERNDSPPAPVKITAPATSELAIA